MMAQRVFAAVITAVALYGLVAHTGLFTTKYRKGALGFYTNLSNLAMLAYHVLLLVAGFFPQSAIYKVLTNPTVYLSATLTITVTLLVYWVLLAYNDRRHNPQHFYTTHNFIVHLIVPVLCIAEWALLADKSSLNAFSALVWLVVPLAYVIYAEIRAKRGQIYKSTGSAYPYAFMDRHALGIKKYLRNMLLLVIAFYLVGAVFCLAAYLAA